MGKIVKYYKICPEVPAGFGEYSIFDRVKNSPLKLTKVHLVFEGWLGGDLLAASPIFYITDSLRNALSGSHLTGISAFRKIDIITKSDTFLELYPDKELPEFYSIEISGSPYSDDFGTEGGSLIISDFAKKILLKFNLSNSEFSEMT